MGRIVTRQCSVSERTMGRTDLNSSKKKSFIFLGIYIAFVLYILFLGSPRFYGQESIFFFLLEKKTYTKPKFNNMQKFANAKAETPRRPLLSFLFYWRATLSAHERTNRMDFSLPPIPVLFSVAWCCAFLSIPDCPC